MPRTGGLTASRYALHVACGGALWSLWFVHAIGCDGPTGVPINDGGVSDGTEQCPVSTAPVGACSAQGQSCGPYFGCSSCTCNQSTWNCGGSCDASLDDAPSEGAAFDAGLDGAASGAYQCTVTQIRSGDCAEPWPPGFSTASARTFSMTIAGGTIDIPGWFYCVGSWNGNVFTCTITGTSGAGGSCPGVPWAILAGGQQPNNDEPLQAGQIWAGTFVPGTPSGNGFDAVCQH
jgi:hypothetical protein